MTAPTFSLPPCPQCSSIALSDLPYWRYAHNTSRVRGHGCYIFTGCSHAIELGKLRVQDESAKWAEMEAQWAKRCAELLEAKSERWKEHERAHFKRTIEHKHFIPGAVEELALEEVKTPQSIGAYLDNSDSPF